MPETTGKTAFVFPGGGSHGAVEVGMLKALVVRSARPDFVVGSSVGAINAAYYAGDPAPGGVERLEQLWRGLRRRDVFPVATLRSLGSLLSGQGHLIDPGPLRRLLERSLPYRRLEDARVPCHVLATDVLQGTVVRLQTGSAVDALLATTALPAVFPPVCIDGRFFIDGGVGSSSPIAAAVSLGAARVVVLTTGFTCALRKPPGGLVAMALHALNLLTTRLLLADRERFAGSVQVALVPPLCPLATSPYDFTQTRELIDRAEETTARWLEGGGLERDDLPASLRSHRH